MKKTKSMQPHETRLPVQVYAVRLMCSCGTEMAKTGKSFLTQPPKYEHQCPACRTKQISPKEYPHFEFKEQEKLVDAPSDLARTEPTV